MAQQVRELAGGLLGHEALIDHPGVVVELAHVAAAVAGRDHHHHGVGRQLTRHAQGRDDRRAGGAAHEDALLAGEPAGHVERLHVVDALEAVHEAQVDGGGHAAHADALEQVALGLVARVDRAGRVGAHDDYVGVLLFEVARRARHGAAGAHRGHVVGDLAVGVVPDFGARRAVVGLGVVQVAELAGLVGVGDLGGQPVGDHLVVAGVVGRHVGGRDDDLGAVGLQEADLVLAHLVRHHEDAAVALHRGGHGQPDARVAAGGLDDGGAGLDQPALLGLLQHVERGAVLDAAAGVQALGFEQHGAGDAFRDLVQLDERRVADAVQDGVEILHGQPLCWGSLGVEGLQMRGSTVFIPCLGRPRRLDPTRF
ncbi:hypothetical protein D3C72_555410 [compost metagenome]